MVVIDISYKDFFHAVEIRGAQVPYYFAFDRKNPPKLAFLRPPLYLERNAEIRVQQVVILWLIQHVFQIGPTPQIELFDCLLTQLLAERIPRFLGEISGGCKNGVRNGTSPRNHCVDVLRDFVW